MLANSRGGRAPLRTGIPRNRAGVASTQRMRNAKEPNKEWAQNVERYIGQTAGHQRSGEGDRLICIVLGWVCQASGEKTGSKGVGKCPTQCQPTAEGAGRRCTPGSRAIAQGLQAREGRATPRNPTAGGRERWSATEGEEQGTSEAGGKETDKRHTRTLCREAGRAKPSPTK